MSKVTVEKVSVPRRPPEVIPTPKLLTRFEIRHLADNHVKNVVFTWNHGKQLFSQGELVAEGILQPPGLMRNRRKLNPETGRVEVQTVRLSRKLRAAVPVPAMPPAVPPMEKAVLVHLTLAAQRAIFRFLLEAPGAWEELKAEQERQDAEAKAEESAIPVDAGAPERGSLPRQVEAPV